MQIQTETTAQAEKPRQPRRRPTLDERIETAKARLAAKEAERDNLASALRSLKASKMNKDRKAARALRTRRLVLIGNHFVETLLKKDQVYTGKLKIYFAQKATTLQEKIKTANPDEIKKLKKTQKDLEELSAAFQLITEGKPLDTTLTPPKNEIN